MKDENGKTDEPESEIRRNLLCASGAGTLAAIFGGFFSTATGVRAQSVTQSVPVVDRLEVQVVTDSFHQALAPSETKHGIDIRRFSFPVTEQQPRHALHSEFGLSLHLKSWQGDETREILLDFGYTPEALLNNMRILNIEPERLAALVLSHGHYDHFGGLLGFLQASGDRLPAGIPLYVGGEECFCTRELNIPDRVGNFGYLDRDAIRDLDVQITFAERPSIVADHAFTTGQIAAETFERVLAPTRMRVGITDGVGCFPEGLSQEKQDLSIIPDDFEHEQATCFHVRDRGLVVITSCGHRGVVNSTKRAMAVAGTDRVHAVLGGFHLSPHTDEYVQETALMLKELQPDLVVPMHCTGEAFHRIIAEEMPDNWTRSYNGSRYTFGA